MQRCCKNRVLINGLDYRIWLELPANLSALPDTRAKVPVGPASRRGWCHIRSSHGVFSFLMVNQYIIRYTCGRQNAQTFLEGGGDEEGGGPCYSGIHVMSLSTSVGLAGSEQERHSQFY